MKRTKDAVNPNILITILSHLLIAMAISIVFVAILSLLLVKEVIPEKSLVYFIPVLHYAVSLWGAFLAGKKASGKLAIVCGGTTLGYCLVLISITILFFGGEFKSLGIGFAMCAASAITACLLCSRKRTRRKKSIAFL